MSLFFGRSGRLFGALCAMLFFASTAHAGVIHGVVTDTTGSVVKGATIVLYSGGKYVSTTVSMADGTYQFTTGRAGRFAIQISAETFREVDVPVFYAGASDNIERNLVLEPEWVHQSVVVTATGTPVA